MSLDPETLALAEKLKVWHADRWGRDIDPFTSEGHLDVMWFGGRYCWYVETRASDANASDVVPRMVRLAEGRADTIEEAQAAADAAWENSGAKALREKEKADLRANIARQQERLAALDAAGGSR